MSTKFDNIHPPIIVRHHVLTLIVNQVVMQKKIEGNRRRCSKDFVSSKHENPDCSLEHNVVMRQNIDKAMLVYKAEAGVESKNWRL